MKLFLLTFFSSLFFLGENSNFKGEWEIVNSNKKDLILIPKVSNENTQNVFSFKDSLYQITHIEKETYYKNSKNEKLDTLYVVSESEYGKYIVKQDTLILFANFDLPDSPVKKDTFKFKINFKRILLKSIR